MKKFLALLLALAMVASLAACGGSDAPAANAPAADAPAKAPEANAPAAAPAAYKDELNIAINANPPTLDAHAANTNIVGTIGSHIYEPLFAMNADNVPTAVLADSYELAEDGITYTIKLRQGVKFHNGQEMTADDVVPSMENWLVKSTKATPIAGTTFAKPGGTLNLFFNTTKGIMAKEEMRDAIMACLNCDDIMMASYVDPNLYSLNQGWMNPASAIYGSKNGEHYSQNNVEKAKELLTAAGYNNEEIILVTTPDYPAMYNSTLVVHAQLVAAGINAKVEQYDFATFMEHRANPDQFSLFITSNSYNILPVTLSVLNSTWAGLNAEEVTAGIEAIKNAASSDEAGKAWAQLEEFLYDHGAASVLGHYYDIMATTAGVEGFDFFNFPIYWNVKVPA